MVTKVRIKALKNVLPPHEKAMVSYMANWKDTQGKIGHVSIFVPPWVT